MNTSNVSSASSEWRQGWRAIVSGAFGMALINMPASVLGVLMIPIGTEYGWSRGQISAGQTIMCLSIFLVGPCIGQLSRRFGIRKVALVGLVAYSLAVAGASYTGPDVESWYLIWALAGLSFPLGSSIIWMMSLSYWFDRNRGLAMALAMSGAAIANILAPIVAVRILSGSEWRDVYLAIGAFGLLAVVPAVWLLFLDHGSRRDDGPTKQDAPASRVMQGPSLREVLSRGAFWRFLVAVPLVSSTVGALFIHYQPLIIDRGISPELAARYFSLIGVSVFVGRICTGYLLDRLPAAPVTAFVFALPGLSCLMLLNSTGAGWEAIGAAVLLGLAFGSEADIIAFVASRYFGMRSYTEVYSILFGAYAVLYGLAPTIAGIAFDRLGSYTVLLQVLIIFAFAGSVLTLTLGKYPKGSSKH